MTNKEKASKFKEGFSNGLFYAIGLFIAANVLTLIFVGFHLIVTHVRVVLV